ncbi:Kinase, CK1 Casein kinase [Spironucleus salmonicida]|uniref:Kinase, CK1 Casein kinase n=1 Tax=Spironucleus salmonicida TaxID=348837 RepID=V6LN71_9EUKA|nr:Kinase, CK1 Casein kinase [Spironucleus salmonicida]|eukprot:EST42159.1 Kinase, CK1 Casein kinase [Spironucleus salmonicida]
MNEKIGGKYQIVSKIDQGAFGQVFFAKVITSKSSFVAVKRESVDAKPSQLVYESRIFSTLAGEKGFPQIYFFSQEEESNWLVMTLLGPSLEHIFQSCQRKFSLKTTMLLGIQMLNRLEVFHHKTFIHRDQKPNNYCIGLGKERTTVFLIDYGLSKRYQTNSDGHIPYREQKALTGTPRYCSINTHLGIEQSRRDDLESLSYILVYFMRGSLPWQGIRGGKKEKYEKIMESKVSVSVSELCRGTPPELKEFVHYARSLRFTDRPDYSYIKKTFASCLERCNQIYDTLFDWVMKGIDTDNIQAFKSLQQQNFSNSNISLRGSTQNSGSSQSTFDGEIRF